MVAEVNMKILVSSTEYKIIIDLKETSLIEWLMCLEAQYPLEIDDENNKDN